MASAKRSADKVEDIDIGAAVEEVESEGKSAGRAVTGRPNDTPILKPMVPNSTFGSRAKGGKRVATASNKAVTADETVSK